MEAPKPTPSALHRLHPGIQACIKEKGWPDLREIQARAVEPILAGRDCLLEAPTAGGKTEAVLFPTLTRAAASEASGVRVLYLAPLRALLNNLELRGEEYARACGLRAFKWHGDVSQRDKVEALKDAPDLLLTTPESVEAILLRKGQWRELFAGLETVIIDEAHNFAAGDRGGHLLCLLARLERGVGRPVQRIAVSATVGNPDAMLDWLVPSARPGGERVHVPGASPQIDFEVRYFDDSADNDETPPEQTARWRFLTSLYDTLANRRSIVFAGSRRGTESLVKSCESFTRATGRRPLTLRTHHSAVSKFFREEAEELIQIASEQGLDAIVSTSTLELGIDIGELDAVVQWGGLSSPGSFLQRVGRTGRRPGKPRFFRGLCSELDELLLTTATVQLGLDGRAEALALPGRAFHLIAHQLLCLSLQENGIPREAAWAVLREVRCFRGVDRTEFEELVDHMVRIGHLRDADGLLVIGDAGELAFLGNNWRRLFAVFDSAPLYEVVEGKAQVGTLDAKFVESLEIPFHFVLAGRLWRATKIDTRSRRVVAVRASAGDPPRWNVLGGPQVPFETAQAVGRLLHLDPIPGFLDADAREAIRVEKERVRDTPWRPGRCVVVVSPGRTARIQTYAGDALNRTLARILSAAELGKVTSDFREVEIRQRDLAPAELRATIADALRGIADAASPDDLTALLSEAQRAYPFSPFAKCLPERLCASTIVDQSLNVSGLADYLRSASVHGVKGTR